MKMSLKYTNIYQWKVIYNTHPTVTREFEILFTLMVHTELNISKVES